MTVAIEVGHTAAGAAATLDLEELLATRLLVQGNSGSGKSHLLRRLLEQSAPWVQQTIIDPEGEFVTLAARFGHLVVDAEIHSEQSLQLAGERSRIHRVSTVLNLEGLDAETRFAAPRRSWAACSMPTATTGIRCWWWWTRRSFSPPPRRGGVGRGAQAVARRHDEPDVPRPQARAGGVIATQRLAKLAKNVAAEASNFLMGRTFLDIDMARAADLLGMERRQAEVFRDLDRGHFMALGPALSRSPLAVRIGAVETQPPN